MLIHGLQKLSLLDYPEKMCATVFTYGCNLRCPFCHNAALVTDDPQPPVMTENEFFNFLEKRQGVLDGVCITGGEPLLQNDIVDFIKKIKNLNFLVKLDTNGSYPDKLKFIVENNLVDYVAMDIKNSYTNYNKTIGLKNFDIDKIKQSVSFLLLDKVDYEFRTTVVKDFHTESDFFEISEMIFGAKRYFLQNFVNSGNLICNNLSGYDEKQMKTFEKLLNSLNVKTYIRGI